MLSILPVPWVVKLPVPNLPWMCVCARVKSDRVSSWSSAPWQKNKGSRGWNSIGIAHCRSLALLFARAALVGWQLNLKRKSSVTPFLEPAKCTASVHEHTNNNWGRLRRSYMQITAPPPTPSTRARIWISDAGLFAVLMLIGIRMEVNPNVFIVDNCEGG